MSNRRSLVMTVAAVLCATALLARRVWAIPLTVVGWLVLTGLVVSWLHHAPHKKEEAART